MNDQVKIEIVPDAACPHCHGGWPNRPKVGDENGVWWWRCYTEGCPVAYYDPESGEVEWR